MKTTAKKFHTIIDDGQFRFPVRTADLEAWVAKNGPITTSNYEQFCSDVPCTVLHTQLGSAEMIDVCEALYQSGSEIYAPRFRSDTIMNTYDYATDAEQGEIEAETVQEAYAKLRQKLTRAMIEDGATLWVENADQDSTEPRLTLGKNAE